MNFVSVIVDIKVVSDSTCVAEVEVQMRATDFVFDHAGESAGAAVLIEFISFKIFMWKLLKRR